MIRRFALAVLAALTFSAGASDRDADALRLADEAPDAVAPARDWRGFAELGLGAARQRSDGSVRHDRRLSFDVRIDHAFAGEWRAVFADRLDIGDPAQAGGDHAINTVKEAYLGWRPAPEALLDFGRINARYGVATGYNPTDFFRAGALRSIVSIDPASLKENRQGSVMLRSQWLWTGGSLTALVSPAIERRPSRDGFNLGLGATNPRDRLLVALSQEIGSLNPQFLLYREAAAPARFGLNLTGLLNDATVAHVEWSGGRGAGQLEQALGQPARASHGWRNRLATGLTFTTANKLSLTAEWHYNGGGLDDAGWAALRRGPTLPYIRYRLWGRDAQELPTRQAFFLRAMWQDALVPHLDLTLMHNRDLVDASRRTWLEARYHAGAWDYALQWQRSGGRKLSSYGVMPDSRSWQALVRYYFN